MVTLTSEYIRHRVTKSYRRWESDMSERAATIDVIETHAEDPELADAELLVEEVSIDGMCGVY